MVTFCSKVISKASLLSHSDSAAPSVPIWLCRAGPGPSAPGAGRWAGGGGRGTVGDALGWQRPPPRLLRHPSMPL